MTTWTDDNGDILATDDFTHDCPDCGQPIKVTDGVSVEHDCPIPEPYRGRVVEASAESMRWTCETAGHPLWSPLGDACICGTWADMVVDGAVIVHCTGEDTTDG